MEAKMEKKKDHPFLEKKKKWKKEETKCDGDGDFDGIVPLISLERSGTEISLTKS
jgi:hypothetical protein